MAAMVSLRGLRLFPDRMFLTTESFVLWLTASDTAREVVPRSSISSLNRTRLTPLMAGILDGDS